MPLVAALFSALSLLAPALSPLAQQPAAPPPSSRPGWPSAAPLRSLSVGWPPAAPPSSPFGWPPAAPSPSPSLFGWPLAAGSVVRRFDPPPRPWLAGHRGVDLAGAPGAEVRAAGAGTVVHAGVLAGRGVISLDHPGGLRTTYEPVTPSVRAGATIGSGAPLGTLAAGHAGCPAAACLHWGLRRGTTYLDPLVLLGLGRVRLLPIGALAPAGP